MSEEKKTEEKTVEVEVLTDHMRDLDGAELHRGDTVSIPESRAEELRELGAVGDKGTVEKDEEEAADRDEREARNQRILTGLETVDGHRKDEREPERRGASEAEKSDKSGESGESGESDEDKARPRSVQSRRR